MKSKSINTIVLFLVFAVSELNISARNTERESWSIEKTKSGVRIDAGILTRFLKTSGNNLVSTEMTTDGQGLIKNWKVSGSKYSN